jgi:hypothetical protein
LIKLEDSAENKQSPEKCPYKSVTTKVNKIKKKKKKNHRKNPVKQVPLP